METQPPIKRIHDARLGDHAEKRHQNTHWVDIVNVEHVRDRLAIFTLEDTHYADLILNFFGTWIPPFDQEMPSFEQAYQRY